MRHKIEAWREADWNRQAHASEVNFKSPTCTLTSTIYYRLQTLTTTTIPSFSYSRHHQHPLHFFIFKSRMDDSWQVFFDHNAWPAHSAGLEKSCHFACHSQVLTLHEFRLFFPCRSSSFRSFVISWTRDCRSSDLITGEMLLSACNAAIPLPQTSFGFFKPGVTRMSGMFRVRRSWSMCWKAAIPRWPLRETTTKKVKNLKFRSVIVGRTYSPMFWWWFTVVFRITQVHCTEITDTDFFIKFTH